MKKTNLLQTLTTLTTLSLCAASVAHADSLIDLNGSAVQYASAPFNASASLWIDNYSQDSDENLSLICHDYLCDIYTVDFGFGVLQSTQQPFPDQYVEGHEPRADTIAKQHSGNQLSLRATHLSPDGKEIVLVGSLTSPGLQGNELLNPGSTAKFLIDFDIQSCDGQPIAQPVITPGSTPLRQILASLNQIDPSAANFCDFKASSLVFESSFKSGYSWSTSSILHVDQDGSASLSSDNRSLNPLDPYQKYSPFRPGGEGPSAYFQSELQDVLIALKANGSPDPAAKQSALAAAQSLSDLLKNYGELAVTLKGHPDKNLRLQQFLDKNTAKIVGFKKTIESNLSKLGLTDLFTILTPINQAYDYVAAIDAQVNSDGAVTMSQNVRNYGN